MMMTPIYLNSSSPNGHYKLEHQFFSSSDDYDNDMQITSPNSQASWSSNSPTCHLFSKYPTTIHDHDTNSHPSQNEDDNLGSQAYLHDDCAAEKQDGLKFCVWKRETNYDDDHHHHHMNHDENQGGKWTTSSKMTLMLKMKKTTNSQLTTADILKVDQDHHKKEQLASSPVEEINANNSNSILNNATNTTCSNNNNNHQIIIRVCSDCNTTKTPLWRSGPQGPKSLCNACGIRQRKARKAIMAAAAVAETSCKNVFIDKPTSLKATKKKILHKDHEKKTNKYKKRQVFSKQIVLNNKKNWLPSSASPAVKKKLSVEDLLISLRKNLANFHGMMFPQDEKEAAILLMALSSGYDVHQ
ncbi:uncharacterized protein [Rutidosis leptorrhynchoides]|uniref:uncharacterized protein n=1 Tax=Rutidosis leptorrhynchoides TaxID=125765 RepID=UPI003A99E25B